MLVTLKARSNTMKQWVARRRKKHEEPTADEIWNRINRNWPTASKEEKEAIFQAAD